MKLRLIVSPTCPKCPKAKELLEKIRQLRKDLEIEILDISKEEDFIKALMLQVASTPTFILNDTPIFRGTVPSLEALLRKIDELTQQLPR